EAKGLPANARCFGKGAHQEGPHEARLQQPPAIVTDDSRVLDHYQVRDGKSDFAKAPDSSAPLRRRFPLLDVVARANQILLFTEFLPCERVRRAFGIHSATLQSR